MLSSPKIGGLVATCLTSLMAFQGFANAAISPTDSIPTVRGALTLQRALQLTDHYQPELRAAFLRAEAAGARIRDARRMLNPSLTATVENFGGGPASELVETTLELQQTLELGGDRRARTATAQAEHGVASAEAAMLRREGLAACSERFIVAWALQAQLGSLRESERLTHEAVAAAAERYRAGASLILERTRAESQALSQAVVRRRTEADLAVARRNLAAQWGATEATFDSLVLPAQNSWDDGHDVDRDVTTHPAMALARANQALADARVRSADAHRVPNLAVSGGVRRLNEIQGTGFVVGVEIPLPLWNGGAGMVAAAVRDREAANAEAHAAAQRLSVDITSAIERVRSAASTYDTLRLRVRPAREELVQDLLRAYRAGRINYLDLIAEQGNLLDTDLALVEAEADLWRARVALDFLVGGGIFPAGPGKEER